DESGAPPAAPQRPPFDEVGAEAVLPARTDQLAGPYHARVVQLAEDVRFGEERLDEVRLYGCLRAQQLDRHAVAGTSVLGAPHGTDSAVRELRFQLVPTLSHRLHDTHLPIGRATQARQRNGGSEMGAGRMARTGEKGSQRRERSSHSSG